MTTTSYRLYYNPGSTSLSAHLLLEELEVPHELVQVDLAARENEKPEYLAINPRKLVPALVLDGNVVTESMAILVAIAETERAGDWLPPSGPERYATLTWMSHLATNVHAAFLPITRVVLAGDRSAAAEALPELLSHLEGIDTALKKTPYLVGDRPRLPDLQLLVYGTWAWFFFADRIAHLEALTGHNARMRGRPATARAFAREFPKGPPPRPNLF